MWLSLPFLSDFYPEWFFYYAFLVLIVTSVLFVWLSVTREIVISFTSSPHGHEAATVPCRQCYAQSLISEVDQ